MITKKRSYKYLLLVPVLGCGLFVASAMPGEGGAAATDVWQYNGNSFTSRYTDTLSYDQHKKQAELAKAGSGTKKQVITSLNGEPVYQNDYLDAKASFGFSADGYIDHIKKEFAALRKNTPDSLAYVTELSLVVDKYGKVVYYSVRYERARPNNCTGAPQMSLSSYGNPEPVLNGFMSKIVGTSPAWKPAMVNGKPVNSFVNVHIPDC